MSANTTYLMGYGSWAVMRLRYGDDEPNIQNDMSSSSTYFPDAPKNAKYTSGAIVPLISAEYSKETNIPTASTFHTPLNKSTRSTIALSGGVDSYSGNVSFELTYELSKMLFTDEMMYRRNFLDLILCDGEGRIDVFGAVWNSFSISGNPNQIVTCNISFSTCNSYTKDIVVKDRPSVPAKFDDLPDLAAYWQYGETGVESFSLSLSRNVNPVYLNESTWRGPTYLRVGMMETNFQITCWEEWFDHTSLILGPRKIVFNSNAFVSSRAYSFSGMNGNGTKSYTVNALADSGNSSLFQFADN